MRKFLLLGDKGYLGSYLNNVLDCDVLADRIIYNNGNEYQYIINCIAKPNVSYCETNIEDSFYSNAYIVNDIKTLYPKSKIINFSSYYVYDKDGLCDELSPTNDTLSYSKQKLLSESLNQNGLNFRLGKLFGNLLSNQYRLTEKVLHEDILHIDNILFNPASVKCIEAVLKHDDFLENNLGLFNLANNGYVSHYEYAKFILDYLGIKKQLYEIKNPGKKFINHGRFLMSTEKISSSIKLNHWKDDLMIFLDQWAAIHL